MRDKPLTIPRMTLVLTASVDTRGMKGAMFTAEQRERMYVDTLIYYIRLFECRQAYATILFVENSGWNLDRISRHVRKSSFVQTHYVALDPNDFDLSKGKSYNELLMMQKVVEHSQIIGQEGRFVKLTGRFPLLNIDKMLYEYKRRGGG